MGKHGMNHYEFGKTQGHSKSKVDSMIKSVKKEGSAKSKALAKKKGPAHIKNGKLEKGRHWSEYGEPYAAKSHPDYKD